MDNPYTENPSFQLPSSFSDIHHVSNEGQNIPSSAHNPNPTVPASYNALGGNSPTNCHYSGPHVHGHHRAYPVHPAENPITRGVILDPDFQNLNPSNPNSQPVSPPAALNDDMKAKMQSPWHHDTHKIADFTQLDKAATRTIDNMTNASPGIVRWDGMWYQQVTSLPLDFGKGYLSSEPIPELMPELTSAYKRKHRSTDKCGPSRHSNIYHWWEKAPSRLLKLQSKEHYITVDDLIQYYDLHFANQEDFKCGEYGKKGSFVLPLKIREELYQKLFHFIEFDVEPEGKISESYVEDIIASKVETILWIENFLITVLCVFETYKVRQFPQLNHFVYDFYDILDSFVETKNYNPRVKVTDLDKVVRIDQVTLWSDDPIFRANWEARWSYLDKPQYDVVVSNLTRRHYICGLFDAMFGIWQAPGHCMFHAGQDPSDFRPNSGPQTHPNIHAKIEDRSHWVIEGRSIPRCIRSGLYFWEKSPARPEDMLNDKTQEDVDKAASVSLVSLDARLIQQRVPFQFKRAERLDEHLKVVKEEGYNKILIYTDWRRFLMLRHHRILVEDSRRDYPADEVSRFQLVSRSTRSATDRIGGRGGDIRYIAYELLQTYALLFYRGVTDKDGEFKDLAPPMPWTYLPGPRKSSAEISCELGLKSLSQSKGFEQLVCVLADPGSGSDPQSADFRVFRHRLEALNDLLNAWKPSTLWQIWKWPGWVDDGYSWWGFIIAVVAIPSAIISVVTSIIQTART